MTREEYLKASGWQYSFIGGDDRRWWHEQLCIGSYVTINEAHLRQLDHDAALLEHVLAHRRVPTAITTTLDIPSGKVTLKTSIGSEREGVVE